MKIGILRETKKPIDRRVPFTPTQISKLKTQFPNHEFVVQSSSIRAFQDSEYDAADLVGEVADCDVLFGVKEVDVASLIPDKTYVFFSHTAKKQPANQKLLQACAARRITLIDYEYLVDENNMRVVAFGYWAGVVGAYNTIRGIGLKNKSFELKSPESCDGLPELLEELKKVEMDPKTKIVLTGEGRVSGGAAYVLGQLKFKKLEASEFLNTAYPFPVFAQLGPQDYTHRKDNADFDFLHFIDHPEMYDSNFHAFWKAADVFIACHFWDPKSPVFFTKEDLKSSDFNLELIGDISCDLDGPIPTTIRSSSIDKPYYGINKQFLKETGAFDPGVLTVMAVDNLPGCLPKEASSDFGANLMKYIVPEILLNKEKNSKIIQRATILDKGELTPKYEYLRDYLKGN